MTRTFIAMLASAAAASLWLALPPAAHADGSSAVVRVDVGASAQSLSLPLGRSAIVELPADARDVLVTNPAVAEAVLRTPRRIFVMGLKSGLTDAIFFDAAGRRLLALTIRVDANTSAIADTINHVVPGAQVQVESINDSVILSGSVASAADADKALQIARAGVDDPKKVLNMLSIAGKDQVMLKVRVVEMDRQVIKQLGVNWTAVLSQASSPQFLIGTTTTFGINGALLGGINASGIGKSRSGANRLTGSLQAFERVGLVRTLAEPNLTAVSGEAAKFLVGGEFPVPTGQATNGQVSIEFKPYGVGLGFTPMVLSGGRISLHLATEVSELSNQGAFSISSGGGGPALVVPGLTVRRAETAVELPSGGALMIAGLLQDKTQQDLDSLPGVRDLPILGALFGSRDYQSGQTELVIIVTPYIVSPTSPADLQTPIDGLQMPDDSETLLLGRLNKTYNHPAQTSGGRTYQGPYGYVVE
ncbi:MAG: type II and III secretion system protein family protein [Caulobacteraceae bacterium]|nr:type II and III secretion system protein family protein [Caulobacteraceae bacterium]